MTPFPLGFGGLGFDLAKPNPFLSWSRVVAPFWADGVDDSPLAGPVLAVTLGAWLESEPRRPLAEELTTRGVGNIV